MIPQKSKKHLLSIPISVLISFLLKQFNLFQWNELAYYDEFLGMTFSGGTIYIQLFITAFVWFCIGFTFEAWQQWKMKEKPTQADTIADIITTLTGGVLGFIIVELIYTLMRWV